MKNIFTCSAILLWLTVAGPVLAQGQAMDGTMHNMQPMQGMNFQVNIGVGMVNHVDLQNSKVNLTHGPIKSLGWPGMTMDFSVKNRALLEGLKPGEKVEFNVVKEGPGKFYIDRITPAK